MCSYFPMFRNAFWRKMRGRASRQSKSYSFLLPSTATAHIFHTRHAPAAEPHPRAKFDVLSEQQPPLLPHNIFPGQVLVDAKMNHCSTMAVGAYK
jgi:nitrate reductase cytochrome c-type subunit